ncbi:MAG: hypothetical protein K8R23_17400 [Chthoniobacter sp.]|nr:hypothetical protein [Chthoniobacter sp.]
MKRVFFTASLFVAAAAWADETAYTALRVVGRSQGKDAINHVLELRGRGGAPQPAVWKVTLDEPRARGGVRELDVQRGKVIAERTPAAARVSGSPMNFNQLNLDSDGAFTVANQEAQKSSVPFDHVDYLLRSGTGGGAPVWQIELSDSKLGRAGSIDIAADTGTVLRSDLRPPSARPSGAERPYSDRRTSPPPPPPSRNDDRYSYGGDRYPSRDDRSVGAGDRYSDGGDRATRGGGDGRYSGGGDGHSQAGEPFRGIGDFFHRVGKRFEKRSTQLENFFTGKGARADRERYRDDYSDGR